MSFNVLLVLEDPTNDQFIAKPIVERLLTDLGKRNAKVVAMTEPHLGGVEQVFDERRWESILAKYYEWDLFVVVIDRDGVIPREERATKWTETLRTKGGISVWALAIEEIEVWALARFSAKLGVQWDEVRREPHVKERFFAPFISKMGFSGPGGGRKALMREAMKSFSAIKHKCPEILKLRNSLKNCL